MSNEGRRGDVDYGREIYKGRSREALLSNIYASWLLAVHNRGYIYRVHITNCLLASSPFQSSDTKSIQRKVVPKPLHDRASLLCS